MYCIYILRCANNKYYVGRTKTATSRIAQHMNGSGSAWTRLHKPEEIVETVETDDVFNEDKYVLKYMSQYGIDNVRGGAFSNIILDESQQKQIKQMISNSNDVCYKCGKHGHYAKECYKIKGNKVICKRCGRKNHTTDKCYAKTHLNGKLILKDNLALTNTPVISDAPVIDTPISDTPVIDTPMIDVPNINNQIADKQLLDLLMLDKKENDDIKADKVTDAEYCQVSPTNTNTNQTNTNQTNAKWSCVIS